MPYLKRIMQIAKDHADDPEVAHARADAVLLEMLKEVGGKEGNLVVMEFDDILKWYS